MLPDRLGKNRPVTFAEVQEEILSRFAVNFIMEKSMSTCRRPLLVNSSIIGMLLFILFVQAPCLSAAGNENPAIEGDPMIKITTLPIKQNLKEVMAAISSDVSRDTGLPETFVTYYWQTFVEIYCPGCEKANIKKPVFVDFYVPAFITEDERKRIMISLATAIEKYTDYSRKDIFMHTHIAEKSQLFIMGDIVTDWSQVGGPSDVKNVELE